MLLPLRPQSRIRRIVLRRPSGIHARQRFVEDQQLRIVDDRLGELDALAHAFAVGADLLVRGLHQIDRGQRRARRLVGFLLAEAVQPHQRAHPFEPGHPVVERILLRAESDLEEEVRVAPDRFAEDLDDPLARLELAGNQLHERRFTSPVRSEQAGDARRHFHRHVIEADDLAVPFRDVIGRDNLRDAARGRRRRALGLFEIDRAAGAHVTTSTPLTRRSRTESDTAISPTITNRDTSHGVVYRGLSLKMTSTTCDRSSPNEIHETVLDPVIA